MYVYIRLYFMNLILAALSYVFLYIHFFFSSRDSNFYFIFLIWFTCCSLLFFDDLPFFSVRAFPLRVFFKHKVSLYIYIFLCVALNAWVTQFPISFFFLFVFDRASCDRYYSTAASSRLLLMRTSKLTKPSCRRALNMQLMWTAIRGSSDDGRLAVRVFL